MSHTQSLSFADQIFSIFDAKGTTSLEYSIIEQQFNKKFERRLSIEEVRELPFIRVSSSSSNATTKKNNPKNNNNNNNNTTSNNPMVYLAIELDDCCNSCRFAYCKLLHTVMQKHICKDYEHNGRCDRGDACTKIHRPHIRLIQRLKDLINEYTNSHPKQERGKMPWNEMLKLHSHKYPHISSRHLPTVEGVQKRFRKTFDVELDPTTNDYSICWKANEDGRPRYSKPYSNRNDDMGHNETTTMTRDRTSGYNNNNNTDHSTLPGVHTKTHTDANTTRLRSHGGGNAWTNRSKLTSTSSGETAWSRPASKKNSNLNNEHPKNTNQIQSDNTLEKTSAHEKNSSFYNASEMTSANVHQTQNEKEISRETVTSSNDGNTHTFVEQDQEKPQENSMEFNNPMQDNKRIWSQFSKGTRQPMQNVAQPSNTLYTTEQEIQPPVSNQEQEIRPFYPTNEANVAQILPAATDTAIVYGTMNEANTMEQNTFLSPSDMNTMAPDINSNHNNITTEINLQGNNNVYQQEQQTQESQNVANLSNNPALFSLFQQVQILEEHLRGLDQQLQSIQAQMQLYNTPNAEFIHQNALQQLAVAKSQKEAEYNTVFQQYEQWRESLEQAMLAQQSQQQTTQGQWTNEMQPMNNDGNLLMPSQTVNTAANTITSGEAAPPTITATDVSSSLQQPSMQQIQTYLVNTPNHCILYIDPKDQQLFFPQRIEQLQQNLMTKFNVSPTIVIGYPSNEEMPAAHLLYIAVESTDPTEGNIMNTDNSNNINIDTTNQSSNDVYNNPVYESSDYFQPGASTMYTQTTTTMPQNNPIENVATSQQQYLWASAVSADQQYPPSQMGSYDPNNKEQQPQLQPQQLKNVAGHKQPTRAINKKDNERMNARRLCEYCTVTDHDPNICGMNPSSTQRKNKKGSKNDNK